VFDGGVATVGHPYNVHSCFVVGAAHRGRPAAETQMWDTRASPAAAFQNWNEYRFLPETGRTRHSISYLTDEIVKVKR
jgi:hypothetical protein